MSKEKIFLIIGFLCFSLLFFYFYPPNTGIIDETVYISMAYTFEKGSFYYDQAGIKSAPASINFNSHLVSRYPPGNSVLLLPFTIIHWKWSFLRGYILMVIGYIIFIIILAHFRLPLYYALLFLFHPSFILYSRTLMSDLPATILCLLGLLFLVRKRIFISGLLFGFSIAIRYPVMLIPLSLWIVFLLKRKFNESIKLLAGAFIGIIPLIFYHLFCFRTIIGPAGANIIGFSITNLPIMLLQFFVSLNILYPFLFIAVFKTRLKEKCFFIIPAVLFLIFFSLQYYIDTGNNLFENIVRGQRYTLPIIPFLLIAYAEVLGQIKILDKVIKTFFVVLILMSAYIHHKHQQFLIQQSDYQKKLYEYTSNAGIIVCNKDIYELINPFIKTINWIPFESEGKLLPVNITEDNQSVYIACLARNENIKKLFFELLDKITLKKEIYRENAPYYFSIWCLGK